jgi:hypothetical protein
VLWKRRFIVRIAGNGCLQPKKKQTELFTFGVADAKKKEK